MIVYVENLKDDMHTKKLLEIINEYSKVAEYKVNIANSELTERKIKEIVSFINATK